MFRRDDNLEVIVNSKGNTNDIEDGLYFCCTILWVPYCNCCPKDQWQQHSGWVLNITIFLQLFLTEDLDKASELKFGQEAFSWVLYTFLMLSWKFWKKKIFHLQFNSKSKRILVKTRIRNGNQTRPCFLLILHGLKELQLDRNLLDVSQIWRVSW